MRIADILAQACPTKEQVAERAQLLPPGA